MHCMFEVFVTPGHENEPLLSDEVIEATAASVMTAAQATQMGFQGLPPEDPGRPRRYIICAERDQRMVSMRLEATNACSGFQIHHIDM